MGIEVGDHFCHKPSRIKTAAVDANKSAIDHWLEAHFVGRFRADYRHDSRRRIHRQGHAKVHQTGGVGNGKCRGIDDRDIVVNKLPADRPTRRCGFLAGYEFGPISVVVIEPSTVI